MNERGPRGANERESTDMDKRGARSADDRAAALPERPLRVAYLALANAHGPTSRYRAYQLAAPLRACGIEVEILPALGASYFAAGAHVRLLRPVIKAGAATAALLRRITQLGRLATADLVIIERESFPYAPALIEAWLARHGGYVLELDDAIYLARGRRHKYDAMVRRARAIIVGNAELARYASRHNADVTVVPTVIDTTCYAAKPSYALGAPPRLGWVGLPFNFFHLASISPSLRRAHDELGAQLVVVSSRPPRLPLPFDFVPWQEASEAEHIAAFDVGLMPLVDSAFARGKCGLKLLQYMAAGVPAVASPVGVNAEIVQHDKNGLLARDGNEWLAAVRLLLADEPLRARLGKAARLRVETDYSLSAWAPRVAALYRRLAAQ